MNKSTAFIIRTARVTARPVVTAWRRWYARHARRVVDLDRVHRRLTLLLAAMYDRPIRIEPVRDTKRTTNDIVHDSDCIYLPRQLLDGSGTQSALTRYRLLAIEQAERLVRGTDENVPDKNTPLERDLYLLSEAIAIDRAIVSGMSGMRSIVLDARADALTRRPTIATLIAGEREVEQLVQQMLASDLATSSPDMPGDTTPEASLVWARAMATELRKKSDVTTNYRGVPPIGLWGTSLSVTRRAVPRATEENGQETSSGVLPPIPGLFPAGATPQAAPASASNGSQAEQVDDSSSASKAAASAVTTAAPLSRSQTNLANNPPSAQNTLDGVPVADGANTKHPDDPSNPSAHPPPSSIPEQFEDNDALDPSHPAYDIGLDTPAFADPGISYPEWDCNADRYLPNRATVRAAPLLETDPTWANTALREHAGIARRARQQFERLRSQRNRMLRQRDGDDLDLTACVCALVDRRINGALDERLFTAIRPARRAIGITLLVDTSGSTRTPVSEVHTVLDIEKLSVLLASEALDALGDPYAILTFSSVGATNVRVATIKDFTERNSEQIRRRISAIVPDSNTRLGTAVRHATALLTAQSVGHRMLIILSDGKPSDTDRYFVTYAVEDTRQAIHEARAQGVHPFCLTVDPEEPEEYIPHIFGPAGHVILRHPDQLPHALLRGVRQMLTS